jgi:Tol biopolymer transport system component
MMTRRTTLVLTAGLAVVLLWFLAGCRVADQSHNTEDPDSGLRASSAGNGSSGGDLHTGISNGKIAFIRHSDIYVMNSDGTGQTNLTRTKAGVRGCVWSPNGKKIAFVAARSAGERSLDIFVTNADGTGETNLTRTKASTEAAPSWSPDSKKITYLRGSDPSGELFTDIYVTKSNGTSQTRLIKARDTKYLEAGFESPEWSPDGEKIAFIRTTRVVPDESAPSSAAPATGPSGLYTMNPDGTALRKLSKEMSYAQSPLWSPDGKQLAFSGPEQKVYVVNANGTQVRELLPNVRASYIDSFAWSPHGKEIAFAAVSYRGELDIYLIIADGTGQTNLTSTRNSIEDELSWSSDGKRIAFTRGDVGDVYGDQGVYVMDADGTGQKRLANNASSPSFAPWMESR